MLRPTILASVASRVYKRRFWRLWCIEFFHSKPAKRLYPKVCRVHSEMDQVVKGPTPNNHFLQVSPKLYSLRTTYLVQIVTCAACRFLAICSKIILVSAASS